jgi:hypothetical protein
MTVILSFPSLSFCPWKQQAPPKPGLIPDLHVVIMSLQSFLWNSAQALVLQYLLQVRIP